MNTFAKEKMNIAVESLTVLSETDLADLCNITEQSIKAGGGFGWIAIPPIETLKKYWNGLILIKSNTLIVGRLNGSIAGASQISFNPPNNEAQKNISKIQSHFVTPWGRGYGLAKAMIDKAIEVSKENNKKSIQLDIRETQSAAIKLFENKGFSKWGENPSYAFINGNRIKGYYYYKDL
jgi:ribosomal protein S18 acetylase RimI-like enzyme